MMSTSGLKSKECYENAIIMCYTWNSF